MVTVHTGVGLWIAVLGTAVSCGGCTLDSVVAGVGMPGSSFDATVKNVKQRGSYIDAQVTAGGFDYRLFFPESDQCRALLGNPEGLRFTWLGLMGRVGRGDERCDAVGVLSLAAWRDRQPRRSREPLPRAPARYQVIYRDSDLVEMHGRFPLAGQLGFTGTQSLVVVVRNDEACSGFADRGTASMEYRASGPKPLVLIAKDQLCPVLGIAQPPPQVPPRGA